MGRYVVHMHRYGRMVVHGPRPNSLSLLLSEPDIIVRYNIKIHISWSKISHRKLAVWLNADYYSSKRYSSLISQFSTSELWEQPIVNCRLCGLRWVHVGDGATVLLHRNSSECKLAFSVVQKIPRMMAHCSCGRVLMRRAGLIGQRC